MKRILLALSFVATGIALECRATDSEVIYAEPTGALIDLVWLDNAMIESDALLIHEGLPHQMFEATEHQAEIKRAATLKFDNQLVYARPLNLSELDRRKLSEILSSGQAWVPPRTGLVAMKLCGGFHADYAVTWLRKDQPLATVLICFSCHELRFVQGERVITADMTKTGYEGLLKLLKGYRQERPSQHERESLEQVKPAPTKSEPPKVEYKR